MTLKGYILHTFQFSEIAHFTYAFYIRKQKKYAVFITLSFEF